MEPMKQYEVLNWASSFLKMNHREENIARLLLQHHLKMDDARFHQMMREPVPEDVLRVFKKDIEKHALSGIPVQHLIGYAPFYGADFIVNKHVLVPRFETEELVEHVVEYMQSRSERNNLNIVDIGTGSGVIAITLKRLFPELKVYATDVSSQALGVAEKNAVRLDAEVDFLQGDLLQPLIAEGVSPNIIISNPPYISEKERGELKDTVKNFDPEVALFANENGLSVYRKILTQMCALPKGTLHALFFEIGMSQGVAVTDMIQAAFPEGSVETIKDIAGHDRVIKKLL